MRLRDAAIFGDVHGNIQALNGALKLAPVTSSTIVFVGDYVNRGPDSKLVLDRLVKLRSEHGDAHFLVGNHDAAMLDCLEHGRLVEFLAMGGARTIRSYIGDVKSDVLSQFRAAVPGDHWEFLRSLVPRFQRDELVAVHDAVSIAERRIPDKYVVAGHTVQADATPSVLDHLALIDTGCGSQPDGKLCVFMWPSRNWGLVSAGGTVDRNISPSDHQRSGAQRGLQG